MSEMIERVAKAIFDQLCPGIRMTDHDKAEYENTARAAIEAMREPTDEQRNNYYKMKIQFGQADHSTFIDAEWERMIDAALK